MLALASAYNLDQLLRLRAVQNLSERVALTGVVIRSTVTNMNICTCSNRGLTFVRLLERFAYANCRSQYCVHGNALMEAMRYATWSTAESTRYATFDG
ncbi:hypothetical protein AVEN_271796-1 [Araneus ventricosus]|uniref:Uncharacterized protein n=1 Tax=Araneus ventricosus TaxID=182803 RepID=A0A4Y2W671_ARAVE|nr:hypothetical protein AVEN_271796-1 [Araneus ventricosus]